MKAVIVDDEFYALQGLKMELEELGYIDVVGLYEDGEKMLSEIMDTKPDIIFLDVEMPQMDGFALCEKLSELGCLSKVIFITAYAQYAVKAFEVNAMDYIVKPVTRERLLKTLERVKPIAAPESSIDLRFTCFRHFSILADGKEINSGWRTRKAEELIAFLISESGSFVSKEKIAETLWPEHEQGNALSNLYMAYYYIKKQEAKTGVLFPIESERGKMRVRVRHMNCDLFEFNRLLEGAAIAHGGERVEFLEKAAALYKGLPFEDSYFGWADAFQANYEYRYMEILDSLVHHFLLAGDERKSKYYQTALNR